MPPELPPDDDRELLDKVDALLKRHQPKRYTELPEHTEPPPAEPLPAPAAEAPDFSIPDVDDIPVLTDIVAEPAEAPAPANMPDDLLLDLEERLYRELEARIAPQLSLAFGKALDELLSQAKKHIGAAVREHLAEELRKPRPASGK